MNFALIFGVLALMATPAFAQTTPSPESKSSIKQTAGPIKPIQIKIAEARKALALDLIKQSHALNDQLEDDEKVGLLNDQARCAMAADKKLAREWAHELFDLGTLMDSDSGRQAQMRATELLSREYPEEALATLEQIDPKILAPGKTEVLGTFFEFYEAERHVFLSAVTHKLKDALPRITHVASTLGSKGRYPYWPVMSAAIAIDNPETTENVAKMLLARFQQRVDAPFAVFEFSKTLRFTESQWPKELMKPAIEAVVDILQRYPIDENSPKITRVIITPQGSATTVRGPSEIELARMRRLMKRQHPALLERLTKTYPILADPAATALGSGIQIIESIEYRNSGTARYKPRAIYSLKDQIRDDPSKAEEIISSISDPELRAEALAFASYTFSFTDPERAARLAEEAEKVAAQVENSLSKLQALCVRIRSDAAAGYHSEVVAKLDQAFLMADKLMRKAIEDGDSTFEVQRSLIEAVSETVKVEPELTVAHINGVYLPHVRSELLISAAEALFPPPSL